MCPKYWTHDMVKSLLTFGTKYNSIRKENEHKFAAADRFAWRKKDGKRRQAGKV